MNKKTPISKKRRGPAPTGVGSPQLVRMHSNLLSAIDVWIRAQGDKMTRPEAIRRLVEIGLSKPFDQPRVLSTSTDAAARAAELGKSVSRRKK